MIYYPVTAFQSGIARSALTEFFYLLLLTTEKGGLNSGDGLIQLRARGPNEEDYFEILSKFKLSFNLLAKLKGYIHDPNAPELVHFLFTPLAIIIEAAKNNRKFRFMPLAAGLQLGVQVHD